MEYFWQFLPSLVLALGVAIPAILAAVWARQGIKVTRIKADEISDKTSKVGDAVTTAVVTRVDQRVHVASDTLAAARQESFDAGQIVGAEIERKRNTDFGGVTEPAKL